MKTLQEQIAEFEANGCIAGDRKWKLSPNYDDTFSIYIGYLMVDVYCISDNGFELSIYDEQSQILTSTTLESALCEALDIVKAKVIDLAKELGFVCFDREQIEVIKKSLTPLPKRTLMWGGETKEFKDIQQLQKYIEEQGNE